MEIDLSEMMRGITLVARKNGVEIRNRRLWMVRAAVATVLFRWAARVAGFDFQEKGWEE
jgi:hypothetical protein